MNYVVLWHSHRANLTWNIQDISRNIQIYSRICQESMCQSNDLPHPPVMGFHPLSGCRINQDNPAQHGDDRFVNRTAFYIVGVWLLLWSNNSSPPSAAYLRQWIGSALVQIMACRLFGAKPLSKPYWVIVNWTLSDLTPPCNAILVVWTLCCTTALGPARWVPVAPPTPASVRSPWGWRWEPGGRHRTHCGTSHPIARHIWDIPRIRTSYRRAKYPLLMGYRTPEYFFRTGAMPPRTKRTTSSFAPRFCA